MYRYTVKYGMFEKNVLSEKHHTSEGFNNIIVDLIKTLEKEGYNLSAYSEKEACEFIFNELVNNSEEFISETNNNIICDLRNLIPKDTSIAKKEDRNVKQVLVVRADLLNPVEDYVGKMIAQAGHASSGGILNLMSIEKFDDKEVRTLEIIKDSDLDFWINGVFKKITVYVNSEEELFKVHKKALKKGLNSVLIQDAGLTCFEPGTYTCCGIGPAPFKAFNGVTNHLPIEFKKN